MLHNTGKHIQEKKPIWWTEAGGEFKGVAICVDVQDMEAPLAPAHFRNVRTETQVLGRQEER